MRSPFQELDECRYFQWLDNYIRDRGLRVQVLPPILAPVSSAVEEAIQVAPIVSVVDEEISNCDYHRHNLNPQLSQIVHVWYNMKFGSN